MSVLTPTPLVRRRALTPYVVVWLVLAGLALSYLALLSVRPDLVANLSSPAGTSNRELLEAQRSMSRALADLDPLRQTVGELKLDVANLKSGLQSAADRDALIADKLAAIETAAAAPSRQEPPKVSENILVAPIHKPERAKLAVASPAPEQASPTIINSTPSAAPIVTGSISKPPAAAAKTPPVTVAAVTPAAKKPPPIGIQLATGPSVNSLRLSWSVLTDRHADAVKNLQPRYVVGGNASERTYGLVAGPLASTDEAQSLCKTLGERGVPCKVGTFRGNSL